MEEESRYWRETEDVITLMDNEQDAPHKYEEQPKYSLTFFPRFYLQYIFPEGVEFLVRPTSLKMQYCLSCIRVWPSSQKNCIFSFSDIIQDQDEVFWL